MKTYTAKFDRSENKDFYILLNKKILKTKIVKTRITDQSDWTRFNGTKTENISGLKVEYLVSGEEEKVGEHSVLFHHEWVDESDIFETKEELIAKID